MAIEILVADLVTFALGARGSEWGIFQNGAQVVSCDNVVSVGFRKDWAVADYPLEDGAFETYDKVETPFEARVRFSAGGSADKLTDFLASIEAICETTELYDVVTPQRIYEGANISSINYNRTANNGVGLMTVEVRVVEVRVSASSEFTSTKAPNGAAQTNSGVVQPSAGNDSALSQRLDATVGQQ